MPPIFLRLSKEELKREFPWPGGTTFVPINTKPLRRESGHVTVIRTEADHRDINERSVLLGGISLSPAASIQIGTRYVTASAMVNQSLRDGRYVLIVEYSESKTFGKMALTERASSKCLFAVRRRARSLTKSYDLLSSPSQQVESDLLCSSYWVEPDPKGGKTMKQIFFTVSILLSTFAAGQDGTFVLTKIQSASTGLGSRIKRSKSLRISNTEKVQVSHHRWESYRRSHTNSASDALITASSESHSPSMLRKFRSGATRVSTRDPTTNLLGTEWWRSRRLLKSIQGATVMTEISQLRQFALVRFLDRKLQ